MRTVAGDDQAAVVPSPFGKTPLAIAGRRTRQVHRPGKRPPAVRGATEERLAAVRAPGEDDLPPQNGDLLAAGSHRDPRQPRASPRALRHVHRLVERRIGRTTDIADGQKALAGRVLAAGVRIIEPDFGDISPIYSHLTFSYLVREHSNIC